MDIRKTILLVIFTFSLLMLWSSWQQHKRPPASAVAQSGQTQDVPATGAIPAPATSVSAASSVPGAQADAATPGYADHPKAVVRTDLMVVEVSAQGGDITRVAFTQHKSASDLSKDFVLMEASGAHRYAANGGLTGDGVPNHKSVFELPAGEHVLKEGTDKLELRMKARSEKGVVLTKVYTFQRGSYQIGLRYEIANETAEALNTKAYFQLVRDDKPSEQAGGFFTGVTTYTGPAFYTEERKFRKEDFSEAAGAPNGEIAFTAGDGWAAMVQHYFVAGLLPPAGVQREFFVRKIADGYFGMGVKLPVSVAAGAQGSVETSLYVGPQEQAKLASIAPGFDLVVDYGFLTIIAAPLFWLLELVHKVVGNWGWAIIVVTILIKLAFFPLSAAGYKSMAKMKTLMPRMKQIQERHAGDRMKMNQEMMEMYRREKVNPMGGCLPILIQIPVFIALYWVLLGSVEMRQAPWLGWITDLSVMDKYYVLPLLMGATMLIQTKLNPEPPDPIQAKIMLAMPIIFTVMFLWFPSGLVLYWVVNNILSIAQQWYINRMIAAGESKVG